VDKLSPKYVLCIEITHIYFKSDFPVCNLVFVMKAKMKSNITAGLRIEIIIVCLVEK